MGVRELKNRLSEILRRVRNGEHVTVTDRGRAIAVIRQPDATEEHEQAITLVREGLARWGGGKPRGAARPARIRGKPISDTVLEERR